MGGRGASSSNYSKTLSKAENKIKEKDKEYAVIISKRGEIIIDKTSQSSKYVTFTNEEVNSMKNSILTHNHPSGNEFSSDDIKTLVYAELHSIRATSKNITYELKKIKNIESAKNFADDYKTQKEIYKKTNTDKIVEKATKDYKQGKIKMGDYKRIINKANKDVHNNNRKWLKEKSHLYGYKYREIGG